MTTESRMLVEQFTVKNFRSIREETFYFQDCTILLGKNNCGKSNTLDALRFLFEATNRDLTENDYWDKEKDIEFEATLSGVEHFLSLSDERHRSKIERCLIDGKITIRKGTNTNFRLQIYEPEKKDFGTPTGIDQAFKQFLPELITIQSLADVTEEVKGKATNAVGKILKLISEEIENQINPELDSAFQKVNSLLNIVEEKDNRVKVIAEIESLITNFLTEIFKNTNTRLKVTFPTAMDILKNLMIDVFDGEWTPYFRKGQGLQRGLYLSLFRAYAELTRKQTETPIKRPIFLIFEEPEAFLHPQLQEEMRKLIEQVSTKHQVLLSTHSPFMVSAKTINNIIRLHQSEIDDTKRLETKVCGKRLTQSDFETDNKLLNFINLERSSRIFFSDNVLLVEGISDRYLYRAMSVALGFGAIEEYEYEIVECGTKDNLRPFKKLLEKMGIKSKIITDLDFLINGAGKYCSEFELREINDTISQLNEKLEKEVQHITDVNQDKQKKLRKEEKLKILASEQDENICTLKKNAIEKFAENHVFILSKGQIENYAGLGKNNKSGFLGAAEEILGAKREIKNKEEIKKILNQIFKSKNS